MNAIPESDPKRLNAVYDEAAAAGESEESYSAAQRLLDEAVDAAVREEYPSRPQWRTEQEPIQKPKAPPVVHVLELAGTSIKVEARSLGQWWVTLIHGATIKAADESDAKRVAIDTARRWLTEARAACPGLDLIPGQQDLFPTNGEKP